MDRIADWFGADVLDERLDRIRRFWGGEGRYLVTVQSTTASYRQCFDDETIVARALENLEHQATLPGVNLPTFFPDFGTVSTAKHWGGEPHFDSTGGNLFVEPVAQTAEEALAIEPRPVDDPDLDTARALRLYRTLCDRLETDRLWLRTPDFQGTLNTAGLVMNQEELFMAMATDPDAVHAFLDRVNAFLIAFADHCKRETDGRVIGSIWPYTLLPADLGMSFTEDLMPLLSADMFGEFGIPQVERFSRAFGGVHIHCCGQWAHQVANLAGADANVRAVEFHHPFTTLEAVAPLAGRSVFVPYYNADADGHAFPGLGAFYEHLLATAGPDARFWFAFPEDNADALAFVERHGEAG